MGWQTEAGSENGFLIVIKTVGFGLKKKAALFGGPLWFFWQ